MWAKYLYLDPNNYNCFSFVEAVTGYEMTDLTRFANAKYDTLKSRWGTDVSFQEIDSLAMSSGFKHVVLVDLQPRDILVFKLVEDRPLHFGVYIGNNQFIHLRKRPKIDDFTQEWRDKVHFIYRR